MPNLAPDNQIELLLKNSGAVLHRQGSSGGTSIYHIPGVREPFVRAIRSKDWRASQNGLSELRRLLRTRSTVPAVPAVPSAPSASSSASSVYSAPSPPVIGTSVPWPPIAQPAPRQSTPPQPMSTTGAGTATAKAASQSPAPSPVPSPVLPQPATPAVVLPHTALSAVPVMELLTITPIMALDMLDSNTNNRNIRQGYVLQLARDMIANAWKVNNASIGFDVHGRLMDGQHRLWACVEANVPFRTWVSRGLDPDSFDTIDINKTKTIGDLLGPTDGEKNANVLASIVRLIIWQERGQLALQKGGPIRPTVAEVRDGIKRHPLSRDSAAWASGRIKEYLRPSIAGFLHYSVSRKHPAMWEKFAGQMIDGLNLDNTNPVYHLRKRVLESRSRISTIEPTYLLAIAVKTWNRYLEGKPMLQLNYRDSEVFPEPQ